MSAVSDAEDAPAGLDLVDHEHSGVLGSHHVGGQHAQAVAHLEVVVPDQMFASLLIALHPRRGKSRYVKLICNVPCLAHRVVLRAFLLEWSLTITPVWRYGEPAFCSAHDGQNARVASYLLLRQVVFAVLVKPEVGWEGLSIGGGAVSIHKLTLVAPVEGSSEVNGLI